MRSHGQSPQADNLNALTGKPILDNLGARGEPSSDLYRGLPTMKYDLSRNQVIECTIY